MKRLVRHVDKGDIVDFPSLQGPRKVTDVKRDGDYVTLVLDNDGSCFNFLGHVPIQVMSDKQHSDALYAELLKANTLVATIIGGRQVVCLKCAPSHPFIGTALLRGNVGRYKQTCHRCDCVIVPGDDGWSELFGKPLPMIPVSQAGEPVLEFAASCIARDLLPGITYKEFVKHAMFDRGTQEIVVDVNDKEKRFKVSTTKENDQ